jgi:hypothetical protein
MKLSICRGLPRRRWLPSVLAAIIALPPGIFAQQPVVQQPAEPLPAIESLKVLSLSGKNVLNDLERRVMAPLVVQVLDQNSRPVEGAQVVFRFPLKEPTAEFSNHQSAQTVQTNADGQAAAVGWMARGVGTFPVRITVSRANELGEATISMTNVTRIVDEGKVKHQRWWSHKWVDVAIIAGAAGVVVAVVLLTRGGHGTSTVTASPGSPTIGGPQ